MQSKGDAMCKMKNSGLVGPGVMHNIMHMQQHTTIPAQDDVISRYHGEDTCSCEKMRFESEQRDVCKARYPDGNSIHTVIQITT